ncbi:MAG: hypothetical protein BEN19_05950 [Epulopiscium sp. Nuni2H_MBin003]|nr:MAG: hypothetical protein BEN19_05950 [Epulopiscium sp. Nuni2H_MBin003]
MRILKLTGKDELTVKQQIIKEYGENAVVISSEQQKSTGFLGFFKKSEWCMTIALEETPISQPVPEQKIEEESVDTKGFIEKLDTALLETKKDRLKDALNQSLHAEGIEQVIIDEILENVQEDDFRGLSLALYEVLKRYMPRFKHRLPKVNFFIGSTGVGKTTTIAKLTAMKVLEENKKVVLLTADTYRIAAVAQLKTYAEILGVEIETIFEPADIPRYIEKWKDADHIFIDTAGRSHKNLEQLEELKELLGTVEDKQVFLVLNINTQYTDVQHIVTIYKQITDKFALIITKLDETDGIGNLINIASCTQTEVAFLTTGQNVPDDIEKFESLKYIKLLLGRVEYE